MPTPPVDPAVVPVPWTLRLSAVFLHNPAAAVMLLPVVLSGLLGYLMYYGITTTLPDVQQAFHRELQEERRVHQADLREQRTLFREELKMQRDHDRRETAEIVNVLGAMTAEIRRMKGQGR